MSLMNVDVIILSDNDCYKALLDENIWPFAIISDVTIQPSLFDRTTIPLSFKSGRNNASHDEKMLLQSQSPIIVF